MLLFIVRARTLTTAEVTVVTEIAIHVAVAVIAIVAVVAVVEEYIVDAKKAAEKMER